jgi:hypothetical protein
MGIDNDDDGLVLEAAMGTLPVQKVTYKLVSKGRKWFSGITTKGHKALIEINNASLGFEVGQEYTFDAKVQFESSKYGTSVHVFPVSEDQKKEVIQQQADSKTLSEINRWLGCVEEKAPSGYLYEKGIQTLRTLGVDAYPELKIRLDAAIQTAKEAAIRAESSGKTSKAKRLVGEWLGYVAQNIKDGKGWYSKGAGVVQDQIAILKNAGENTDDYAAELERLKSELAKVDTGGFDGETIKISGGSGYGYKGWTSGQITKNPRKEGPEFLFVLTAKKQYVSEEGMSFGVGDEQGYIYSAVTRAATLEEAAPLIEREQAEQSVRKASVRLQGIAKKIQAEGEYPKGETPTGDSIDLSSHDSKMYGGGERFVIGTEWIWHIRGNGGDGDDWNRNNIPGAIAARMPYSADLDKTIRESFGIMNGKFDWRGSIGSATSFADIETAFKRELNLK